MSEMYPPPPSGDQNPQHTGSGTGQTPPSQGGTWPQSSQPEQPQATGANPSQPLYPQQPYMGAWPSQPLYPQQQPYMGTPPSQPLYPQQPYMGTPPSQPLYPQQPYMGAAPSQPLYAQQPPAGYPAYAGGIGAPPPAYVRTNLVEYWKNAKSGKRNLSILTVLTVLLLMFSCVSAGALRGSTSTDSAALTTSQNNDQSAAIVEPTDTPAPTATPMPTAKPKPTEGPSQYKASAKPVTVTDVAKDPNAYKGKTIKFTAVIMDFVQDSSGNTAGSNVTDANDYSSVVQIAYTPSFSLSHVNKGDTVEVWGQGLGAFTGTNGFGATITEGGVQEVYLRDLTTGYSDTTISDPSSFIADLSN